MRHAWLRFFRFVNLPTVPGDVLAGAATVASASACAASEVPDVTATALAAASCAACGLYLFGLADNDIAGAPADGPERPIPAGAISLRAARLARGLCLFATLALGAAANLSASWWIAAFLLAVSIVVYNRTKWSIVMGLCRGLNVLCGGFAALGARALESAPTPALVALDLVAGVWIAYITLVTRYSRGEERDPSKRGRVGFLIGALVYLQLFALLAAYLAAPAALTRNLLLAGAALLIALRILKRLLPGVSAS